jgi:hypothetical protein
MQRARRKRWAIKNLVEELVSASTAARGGASRGTQIWRSAAPRGAPGVPAISHKDNVMSAGACLSIIRLQIASITDVEDRSRARPFFPAFCGGASFPKQIPRHNRHQRPRLHYCTSPPLPTARCCLTRLAYVFPPAEAPDRESVFTLTIRLRGSDDSGLFESARDLLELVCSCDSIGKAEGEAGGPECAQADEAVPAYVYNR